MKDCIFAIEIDSGAAISAVSEEFYKQKMPELDIKKVNLQLVGYAGEKLNIKGCIEPELSFNGEVKKVKFAVVTKEGPPLLGRNFIEAFKLHIVPMNFVQNNDTKEKLKGELGKYNGMKMDITSAENTRPIFCKPRPVPFSFEKAVEEELRVAEEKG